MTQPILEVKNIKKYFPIKYGFLQKVTGHVKAVEDISLTIKQGETFGLVGESGCGKSTLGRLILRLLEPTAGKIIFEGNDITSLPQGKLRLLRKDIQIIFQDPFASLDPRMKVKDIIAEPMITHKLYKTKKEVIEEVKRLMDVVGLHQNQLDRYPHEFSGGQRQRIGIARSLSLKPKLIVADESVSALDVSIQSQILNLLKKLQAEFNLTIIFISHDLSVVKHISDRIGVMYLGNIVEIANKKGIYETPMHPYSQALLSAVPIADPEVKKERMILQGDLPSPSNPPNGCALHPRCPKKLDICNSIVPELQLVGDEHYVACHLYKKEE